MHTNLDAGNEIRRDWPEAAPFVRGEGLESLHSSPWVSMEDLNVPEEERWKLIGDCDINKYWSAMICVVRGELRAFFCEIAGAQAMLHEDNPDWRGTGQPMPDTGLEVVPNWWQGPMSAYAGQVREHCHRCGIPLRRAAVDAGKSGGIECSITHEYINKPKRNDVVSIGVEGLTQGRGERPSTQYLPGVTPGYHGG